MDEPSLLAAMTSLAYQRPVFHSEADLQHALVWELATRHPDAAVRLERPFRIDATTMHVDAVLRDRGTTTALELKHWTRRLDVAVDGEEFRLTDQSAEDVARYDFWKDVVRLEQLVRAGVADRGFALTLTNEPRYWDPGRFRGRANDADFRLHEGRSVTGSLAWAPTAAPGSINGRESALDVNGTYETRWREYSRVGGHEFRFLLVAI